MRTLAIVGGVVVLLGSTVWYVAGRRAFSLEVSTKDIPKLEVREVRCDEQANNEAGWQYQCQGTLFTRDSRYQNGEFLVWYKDASRHNNGKQIFANTLPAYVVMSGGVATLTAGAYYQKRVKLGNTTLGEFDADPGQPQPEWTILGLVRLEPVQLAP